MEYNDIYYIIAIAALLLSELAPFVKSTSANGLVHGLAIVLGFIAKTNSRNTVVTTIAEEAITVANNYGTTDDSQNRPTHPAPQSANPSSK